MKTTAVSVIAHVAVGSNIDPESNIAAALEELQLHCRVEAVSSFYRNAPLDRPEQPWFVNGVFRVRTNLDARGFKFNILERIEKQLGRRRTADPHAARTIDLDLILHGDLVHRDEDLQIPDPDITTRSFIAVPLTELDNSLTLPDTGQRLADLPVARDLDGLELCTEFTERLKRIQNDE